MVPGTADIFTPSDIRQLAAAGISLEEAGRQVEAFHRIELPRLLKPCTLGNGITSLPPDTSELEEEFLKAAADGRLIHFIPASGAATRMGLGEVPKALVPFHRYGSRVATPVEEHIREAAALTGPGVEARLHFTLSPGQESRFQSHVEETVRRLRTEGIRTEVTCSIQDPGTQTLALDEKEQPFREASGVLLLRPGGHGALLANLEHCGAEFAWIRNVDNIAVESHRAKGRKIHRALAGCLIRRARERKTAAAPLRVCGMVPNTGEPGGGPFWISKKDGGQGIRIVESAEVNSNDLDQLALFRSATHFNPVDMICALRDSSGHAYPLREFSDPSACVVTRKTHEGRELQALEWPGLWNGGMAGWETRCVEIPLSLFTPVKTLEDLQRPEHRGE